ncbi:hypothetical protein LP414_33470 [Polaromonas sp. P1(28)-13]|nr:hypothetical protein LP417_31840 [Polaromonas sp. P1-6]UUZ68434.1 hypothetical protein LP416_30610 [Polaromonas sp. P2-4]UUZ76204.1 hypothetical protein LP414_33470 [Polaromonas sp. P1(28)-13]
MVTIQSAPTVCRRYGDFLIQAAYSDPYPVLLAMLFGVEASYLEPAAAQRAVRGVH